MAGPPDFSSTVSPIWKLNIKHTSMGLNICMACYRSDCVLTVHFRVTPWSTLRCIDDPFQQRLLLDHSLSLISPEISPDSCRRSLKLRPTRIPEQVWIIAIIKPKRHLIEVSGQMFCGHEPIMPRFNSEKQRSRQVSDCFLSAEHFGSQEVKCEASEPIVYGRQRRQ
jgi:hypothetical protein